MYDTLVRNKKTEKDKVTKKHENLKRLKSCITKNKKQTTIPCSEARNKRLKMAENTNTN